MRPGGSSQDPRRGGRRERELDRVRPIGVSGVPGAPGEWAMGRPGEAPQVRRPADGVCAEPVEAIDPSSVEADAGASVLAVPMASGWGRSGAPPERSRARWRSGAVVSRDRGVGLDPRGSQRDRA